MRHKLNSTLHYSPYSTHDFTTFSTIPINKSSKKKQIMLKIKKGGSTQFRPTTDSSIILIMFFEATDCLK